ncbi:hypothetical protein RDI58_008794 [Solanum bulbocastanum]|uniref:Uncharacterized protein n=1 Tax=Solanum bulbocastanum TaxID=147425 RepID=A0AAN8YKF9_SOLBU
MADGGEGWLRNHSNMGSRSFLRLYIMERNPLAGRSLTFSTPAGIEGSDGKGQTRVFIDGFLERRGSKIGRFLGVTKIVMATPLLTS